MTSMIFSARKLTVMSALLVCSFFSRAWAEALELEAKPADPYFAKFNPRKAPEYTGLYLKEGDRLAIVGDSITEQKMYSRMIETYLTVCVPELKIETRQFGWSGETADGFLHRMKNDCLRFKPTVVTLCYGMNDYRYKPYEEAIGAAYRKNYGEVAREFKAAGARVVLGSAGCVGKVASWVKSAAGTLEDHNLSLCELRNIDVDIATKEDIRFADVFWPMYKATFEAHKNYGEKYNVAGNDGVHPGWAGHLIMAYAYLKALGLKGDIGTFTVDLQGATATASDGHTVDGFKDGVLSLTSKRYPFCATGKVDSDREIRSGMTLVPFNETLNRLVLIVKNAPAAKYKITWGAESKDYTSDELAKGINLAADFVVNPFSAAFNKVDAAVNAKQQYETKQIKQIFHGKEGKDDMEGAVKKTEAERAPLVAAIQAAVVPVSHTIKIEAQ